MCGILAVVSLRNSVKGADLQRASAIIDHRGPDDEGFLTWAPGGQPTVWAGNDTAAFYKGPFPLSVATGRSGF
jgi:asparagine synthase (glutamine-hydrolysing)